jgi:hypothetical protein
VDLGEPQRSLLAEPLGDAVLVRRDLLPLRTRIAQSPGLHALRDLVDLFVAELVPALEAQRRCDSDVACDRVAVRACLTRDLHVALPRRPAAKQFLYVDHG